MPRRNLRRAGIAAALSLLSVECAQTPIAAPLRSLEASGKVSMLCLAGPNVIPGLPADECYPGLTSPRDYSVSHLYALVTQITHGEVAIIDLTQQTVIDLDAGAPGFNFLPVGAQPVDIVSTPEGVASFVGAAEEGKTGIYALPSATMFTQSPTVRSWPACSLPSRPGSMSVVSIPPPEGLEGQDLTDWLEADRACASPNFAIETLGAAPYNYAFDVKHPNGALSTERAHPGVRKLVVALPDDGDIVIIDAQRLLDRPAGSFDPCPVERRIKLDVDVPATTQLPGTPSGPICPAAIDLPASSFCPVVPPKDITYDTDYFPTPVSFAMNGTTLIVSDATAPVIHRVDLSDPCSPLETAPLLPSSYDDPRRPVYTSAAAVSPLTHDGKRFIYAVDATQGSLMVFDISEPTASQPLPPRTPLIRPHADFFPYSPRDRLALSGPVKDITFIHRDVPYRDPNTTYLTTGVLCDPDTTRDKDKNGPTPGSTYRTSADFTTGAAPRLLRGTFGVAALTNGQVVVIDVDDLDAPCRGPRAVLSSSSDDGSNGSSGTGGTGGTAGGSSGNGGPSNTSNTLTTLPVYETGCETCAIHGVPDSKRQGTSGEDTCRVVVPHEARSDFFIENTVDTGPHRPDFQTFPILSLEGNTVRSDDTDEGHKAPRLFGPAPGEGGGEAENVWVLDRGGSLTNLDASFTSYDHNFVIADLREPRVHVDQDWTVQYEGPLPGFTGQVIRVNLETDKTAERGAFDQNGVFCDRGVLDAEAARLRYSRLIGEDPSSADATVRNTLELKGKAYADHLQITNELLDPEDPYWTSPEGDCSYLACRATFGPADTPTLAREFPIREAYQDAVLADEVTIIDRTDPDKKRTISEQCCFSSMLLSYQVRASQMWVATGSSTGFQHHVTTRSVDASPEGTPESTSKNSRKGYRCVEAGVDSNTGETCDATLLLREGRAFEYHQIADGRPPTKHSYPPTSFDLGNLRINSYVFHNSQLFFGIIGGDAPSVRDMLFTWHMRGGFFGLEVSVGRGSALVSPQALKVVPTTGELLITDGALQGLVLVDMGNVIVNRSFF